VPIAEATVRRANTLDAASDVADWLAGVGARGTGVDDCLAHVDESLTGVVAAAEPDAVRFAEAAALSTWSAAALPSLADHAAERQCRPAYAADRGADDAVAIAPRPSATAGDGAAAAAVDVRLENASDQRAGIPGGGTEGADLAGGRPSWPDIASRRRDSPRHRGCRTHRPRCGGGGPRDIVHRPTGKRSRCRGRGSRPRCRCSRRSCRCRHILERFLDERAAARRSYRPR
jgi:hypothetical protein